MGDYTDTLQVVRVTGLGVEVQNESVGTGDNSNKSFDLKNGNVIADSYTLKYSASGDDSNDFTDLTETTHYTLDKDGGTILLTTAGVTALGTNNLYADYTHSPKASDTLIDTLIAASEKEVDRKTDENWGSTASYTEFFDGYKDYYPTTDEPWGPDYDEPMSFQLSRRGVVNLTGAWFLARNASISRAYRYDSVATTYTEVTDEVNDRLGDSFQPFADTTAAGDYLYIGSTYRFYGYSTLLQIVGVTGGTNTLEYYKNGTWTAISAGDLTESVTGVLNFEAAGKINWPTLTNWTTVSVNGSSALYYIRIKAASTYSTEAEIQHIYTDQDFTVSQEIPLYQVDISPGGRVTFLDRSVPNGTRNVRIDYTQGYTSIDPEVSELAALFAGLRLYANITGGSYDDATGYTIGRKSISIGEVYVNVREVVRQFEERIKAVLNDLGPKATVV